MMKSKAELPLVYSCSGCSSVAQMANDVAVRLDRAEEAEMSCIAGVGGDVGPLVRIAKSGRPILALDGCSLRCAAQCLERQGVSPTAHLVLTDIGIKKRFHAGFDEAEASAIYHRAVAELRSIGTSSLSDAEASAKRGGPGQDIPVRDGPPTSKGVRHVMAK
ncbi:MULTISPECIES: putative zinc-binding protein [Bradyrhizobium]|uniref:putative zinc-binding protein n=1 Tax=Bradyrhizobium TaxID=374 RepID=UPI0010091663|nr:MULTISPECIES: putative zinc-binding protein [Bradyrhizobium]